MGRKWKLSVGVLVSCWLALGIWDLSSISGQIGLDAASSAATSSASPSPSATSPAASPSIAAPATTAAPHSHPHPHPLSVVSIAAFGPDGTTDGDDSGDVRRINSGESGPWHTNWYTTPEFGNLKSGTGLLLSLGRKDNVHSLQLTLGSAPGTDVQVFVTDSPSLSGQTAVSSATGLGGRVKLLTGSGATGRYVIIWFFGLPPNSDPPGTYRVDVYDVAVDGTG